MTETSSGIDSPVLDQIQRVAILAAVAGVVLCILGALWYRAAFLQSYLFAYLYFFGIALGSIAIVMLHNVTGGAWGVVIRQFLLSAARTLPLMAVLFIPVVLGIRWLYPWADHELVKSNHAMEHRATYFGTAFFVARLVGYFIIWIAFAFIMNAWLVRQDRDNSAGRARLIQRWSGIGLALYGLSMSFASVDWVMSLERHWFSTIFGLMFIAGQVLSTIAFVIVLIAILHARHPLADFVMRGHFHDLGNLLLTFVIIWAYLAFSQYLIIWSGNLPEEVEWYEHRNHGAWRYISIVLVAMHFFVPFLLLLSRDTKRQIGTLAIVAGLILVMRFVDLFWLITPSFDRDGSYVRWTDFAAPLAIGGIWVAVYIWMLRGRPLLLRASPDDIEEVHGHG